MCSSTSYSSQLKAQTTIGAALQSKHCPAGSSFTFRPLYYPSDTFWQATLSLLLLTTIISGVFVTVTTFEFHFGVVPQSEVEAGPLPKVQVYISCTLQEDGADVLCIDQPDMYVWFASVDVVVADSAFCRSRHQPVEFCPYVVYGPLFALDELTFWRSGQSWTCLLLAFVSALEWQAGFFAPADAKFFSPHLSGALKAERDIVEVPPGKKYFLWPC